MTLFSQKYRRKCLMPVGGAVNSRDTEKDRPCAGEAVVYRQRRDYKGVLGPCWVGPQVAAEWLTLFLHATERSRFLSCVRMSSLEEQREEGGLSDCPGAAAPLRLQMPWFLGMIAS